jgi:SAM-dependent methyltransferase
MKQTACNLCGSTRYYLVYRKRRTSQKTPKNSSPTVYSISETRLEKPEKIVRCMGCGLVYAVPEESADQIHKAYEAMEDADYVAEEKGRRAQGRIILSRISKFKSAGRLLDVGCGPGFLLDEAKHQGWKAQGVDLSVWAKEYCHGHFGIEVFRGDLVPLPFPDRSFDVVVMNDVIEHLADPRSALWEIRRVLKNDGILYLSTPDIESFLSRVLRARWWGINKFHLFYFSKRTLEQLFHEVGFKSLRHASYPRVFSIGYWAKRLSPYPLFVRWPFVLASRTAGLRERLLKVVLYDQIDVIARKIQRLDTVREEEVTVSDVQKSKPKVTVVLPAYNAAKTLERTVQDIPKGVVDEMILVDDSSRDETVAIAQRLGLTVFRHPQNRGYGANQKTCYEKAIERGAEIIVMVHPDYQYDPRIIPQLIEPIRRGEADAVFGSRMMKGGALEGGMPLWKHNANILLTAFENVILGTYLTEYHSGFRAYSAEALRKIDYKANADGFVFDTQIIVQLIVNRLRIDEIPIRTRYFEEASSIKLGPSILYGLGILHVMLRYWLHTKGILKNKKLLPASPQG